MRTFEVVGVTQLQVAENIGLLSSIRVNIIDHISGNASNDSSLQWFSSFSLLSEIQ